MLEKIFNSKNFNALTKPLIIFGFIVLVVILSLAWFVFGYWLITLVLFSFFDFYLPFSFTYALGGWIIWLIISTIFFPFIKFNTISFKQK